jgi:hypothetical protein
MNFYDAIRASGGSATEASRAGGAATTADAGAATSVAVGNTDAAAASAGPTASAGTAKGAVSANSVTASVTRLLLSPQATLRARDLPRPAKIILLIGPEGGLADNEEEAAIKAGFNPVQLGPRILRTETAALAALAALQHDFGDL